ncbi:MAG: acetate--CoA ligase family protein [Rhodovibrionaceae bacterium]
MDGSTPPLSDLSRLLRPRSIAVIGGLEAAEVVRQCDRMGFTGEIWPVNPKRESIEGRPCYASVDDLPGAPDAAFVGVNRHLTIEVVRKLAARGAGGAVAYASGFKESGEGDLQADLVAAAGEMPLLGPNCYGLINYLDGALLWPDQHGGQRSERGVAMLTQSGNIAINLTMARRALPIAYLGSLGNQAKLGIAGLLEALLEDSRVTAIGLHIEGIDDVAAFERAARKAREKRIPIVALKTGRSEAGAGIAMSHTASLAGSDAVTGAFFRRLGIARLRSLPEFLETLKLLHLFGPLPGRDIASMSCSGGEASLIADAAEDRRLDFRPLSAAEAARVRATLPALVSISNPLDYHTFTWGQKTELTATFAAMLGCGFGITLLVLDFPRGDRCETADWQVSLEALVAAAERTGQRAGLVASLPECLPEAAAEDLLARGVVPFFGIEEALAAIEAAASVGAAWQRPLPQLLAPRGSKSGAAELMTEAGAKLLLAAHGLAVPRGRVAASPEEAAAAAEEIGFPVALKAIGKSIAHKSEAGALRLGLGSAQEVEMEALELLALGEAVLVEEMIEDAVAELIVGINRDPQFGLTLVLGSGGVLVELVGDSRLLLLPASREEILAAIDSLKAGRLLAGYRGKPAGDREAAADAVLAVQDYALAEGAGLQELDVNPLMVRPAGYGAVAADALIRRFKD